MVDDRIEKICYYIRTHMPLETDFKTIDAAVMAVTGNHAATRGDLVNPDDAILIPSEERYLFSGIKGDGWAEGLTSSDIKRIEEALEYAKNHVRENMNKNDQELYKLKEMRNDIQNYLNNNEFTDNNKTR